MPGNEKKTIKLNKDQTISLYKAKENEINGISKRLQEINNLFTEISKAENTLNEIKNVKSSESILMNIGAGVLVECKVNNTKEVKISLPGTIIVSKDIDSVIKDIENRKQELLDIRKKLSDAYNNNVKTLQQISKAIQVMQKQNNKEADSNNVS
ncbi:prefoldin subunit alpha [archaeon]|nr:prefoldin subunit alpha [archaeon]NCP79473.1 prefoldin subunit alpha [archaeon]NCP97416.1 prefoldin subunit alpha [archaeon]NCQ07240.1 prefoldin subunit alpha [archaeon]NCQ51036.1 prefoldin subunit alpha [archaeon]